MGKGHKKPIYRGDCLKMGAWAVFRFKEGLGKKEGVDTPMHTMICVSAYRMLFFDL